MHGKLATVTATQPMSRFGVIDLEQDGAVAKFREKPKTDDWINIGYFIFEPGVFDYLDGDDTVLEDKPLLRLAEDHQIAAFPHHGFWQPMDTFRESQLLNNLWNSGNPPWKVWRVKKKIARVIPAYNESECVDELAKRLAVVFDSESAYDFEAIIVENGSADDTMDKLVAIHASGPAVQNPAAIPQFRWMDGGLTAGLSVIDADAVVLMTADLQDPPEFIPELIRKWEEGYENVYGVVTGGAAPARSAR